MEKEKVDLTLSSEEFYKRYGRKKTISTYTLGCKTNQYETDALMDLFFKHHYEVVDFDDFSDIYVINTCTVTNIGDKKSRQMIRRAKKNNPDGIVVVMGCYAQISPEEVSKIKDVNIVIGTDERHRVIEYIEAYMAHPTQSPMVIVKDIASISIFEEMSLTTISEHTRAFIKIQEGCNQFCSYCIIPYARGRVRSRQADSVIKEVTQLSEKGYKEFVLTGIHIGSYGLDLDHYQLIDLLEELHAIKGVERIRLGSIEPRLIDDAFVDRIKPLYKICDHFHLSLQSGSTSVLKRMNRKYTAEEYLEAVKRLRSIYDHPSITTDIIVGFPGETEAEFEETMAFVKTVKFSEVHVFKFSPREGTPAAERKDQIDGNLKKQRSERLIALTHDLKLEYQETFINHTLDILLEEYKEGKWIGHTSNYLRLAVEDEYTQGKSNTFRKVHVIKRQGDLLIGQFEPVTEK